MEQTAVTTEIDGVTGGPSQGTSGDLGGDMPGGPADANTPLLDATEGTFWTLFERGREDEAWDYKQDVDVSERISFARAAKDILAFANYGGGALLLGVSDDRQLIGVSRRVDQAWLQNALERRLGVDVKLAVYYFTRRHEDADLQLGILAVKPSDHLVVVERTFQSSENEPLIREGDVFTRRGTQSVRANARDHERIQARLARQRSSSGGLHGNKRVGSDRPATSPLEPDIAAVVGRFVEVFHAHGVPRAQIHRIVGARFGLRLHDFRSDHALLRCLGDDLLDWTADTFGIRRQWLDGIDDVLYEPPDFYKRAHELPAFLAGLAANGKRPSLDAFKTVKVLDRDIEDRAQYVALVASVEIARLGNQPIYRYVPIRTDWLWGYDRSRYEFKAVIYLCERLRVAISGYDLAPEVLDRIRWGYVVPRAILEKASWHVTWYPEDYVIQDSPETLEADELEDVLTYIARRQYAERAGRYQLPDAD